MKHLFIEIGSHVINITTQSDSVVNFMEKNFKVVLPSKGSDLSVHIEFGFGVSFVDFDVKRSKDGNVISFERKDYLIEIKDDYQSANVVAFNDFALKHALMNLYSSFIVYHKWGLLIHSSCVRENNKAYLFAGQSGAGKSTVAKLSRPRTILSDEATVIKISDNDIIVYDSPFRSELVSSFKDGSSMLAGIQLLKQSLQNKRYELNKDEAIFHLLDKVFYWSYDPLETKKVFTLCHQLVKYVPIYTLEFQKNDSFWKEIS